MNRIKELRLKNGWRQEDLAQRLHTRQQTVGNYETGYRSLDVETIEKLCDIFDCTADYLLGRSNIPNPLYSEEDTDLIRTYHAADERVRAVVDLTLEPYKQDSRPVEIQLAARGKRIETLSGAPDADAIREALKKVKSESDSE